MRSTRPFLLVVGVVVSAVALVVDDVLGALSIAYGLLVGAIFVPAVGGLFWRRATGTGAPSAEAQRGWRERLGAARAGAPGAARPGRGRPAGGR